MTAALFILAVVLLVVLVHKHWLETEVIIRASAILAVMVGQGQRPTLDDTFIDRKANEIVDTMLEITRQ